MDHFWKKGKMDQETNVTKYEKNIIFSYKYLTDEMVQIKLLNHPIDKSSFEPIYFYPVWNDWLHKNQTLKKKTKIIERMSEKECGLL